MRQKTIDEIARCLKHAEEALAAANATANEALKNSYLEMAGRWRALAESFETSESFGDVEAAAAYSEMQALLGNRNH
jgi:hypothetical protein